jgi:hypothetical protein
MTATPPLEPRPDDNQPTTPAMPKATEPPPVPDATTPLVDYVRANRDAFTEDALRQAALAAGNSPADVEAAIAATRAGVPRPADRGRAARIVVTWYVGVFAVLAVLMLVNPANHSSGSIGDISGIGTLILLLSLGAALIASLVWIASRRAFVALVGVGVILTGLSLISGGGTTSGLLPALAWIVVGVVILAVAARVGLRPGVPASPSMELLLLIPMLMLLAVGGVCVASGLPIPRTV